MLLEKHRLNSQTKEKGKTASKALAAKADPG
jgi:hypothetical protein